MKWSDLHKYLVSNENLRTFTIGAKTHNYYLIPLYKADELRGLVSYKFYVHQEQFQRKSFVEKAAGLGIYDEGRNVSSSHCQDDPNNRYEIVKDDGTPETGNPEIFEYIEDWSDLDGNLSDDSDLDGNVSDDEDFIDDLDRAFDAESEYDDSDVINIYQDNQDELAEVVRLCSNDRSSTTNIYGEPEDWRDSIP